ncbi:response regulator [Niastella caeni]|uniref:Response regulator n=1 Tax=Niastella caeni TaxID=2569763 RepID=A0A4V4H1A0_9BACT|nr:response regulator [Niastella caeni]THU39646.1 response regulator [Niastella caeni]
MKKILVIEDNAGIRENVTEILELANYKVFTAEDGKTGIELALQEKPDLILCDVMMPQLDGFGVLHLLHKNPAIRNTPFIFMSARAERSEMRKGMELGADDYITKPFEKTELLQAIECRLKRVEWLKQDFVQHEAPVNGNGHANGYSKTTNERDILSLLSENRDITKYKRKQIIYVEGNRPARLYYIKKGKIKTYKTNEEGKELIVGIYGEGDFLGYVALLEGTVYKDRAEAMENTELAVIPKDEFDALMNTRREVVTRFMTMMAKNITEKEQLLLGLAYNSLRKKVADALITVNRKYKSSINLSRENLAAIAGTATASMIRTLSEFKSEKLIDISDGAITILNEKELENLLN